LACKRSYSRASKDTEPECVHIAKREIFAAVEKGTISVNRQKLSFPLLRGVPETAYLKSMEECIRLYREAVAHPERFWRQLAEQLCWSEIWDTVLLDALANGEHQWFADAGLNTCQDASVGCLKNWREKEAAGTSQRFELRIFVFATLTMLFWLLAALFCGPLSREGTAANAYHLWRCRPRPDPCSAECKRWKESFADRALSRLAVPATPHGIMSLGQTISR
jgi:hypothetical protein